MMILVLMLLAHSTRVFSMVEPLVLTGVSTSTDTSQTTYIGSNLNSVSTMSIEKSDFTPKHLSMVLTLQSAGQTAKLLLFDKTGTLHLSYNSLVMQSAQAMGFSSDGQLYLFDKLESSYGIYSIQFSSGVFSVNVLQSVVAGGISVPGRASTAFADSAAGSIFVWGTDASKMIYKVDTSTPYTISFSTMNINQLRSAYGMFEQTSDMLIVGMLGTINLAYFKKTVLKIDFTLSRDCEAVAGTTDDLDSNTMFERWICSASNPLVRFDLTNRNSLTRTSPDISLPDTSYTRVHNIGKYRYLALLTTSSSSVRRLQLVYKSNFTLMTHSVLTINQFVVDYSNLGFEMVYDKLYFGLVATSGSNSNFHSYRLELDRCKTRVSGTCTECDLDWYLAPDNTCISQLDFPANSGWDPVSQTVKPCSQSTCIGCLIDYRLCTNCDQLQSTYLNISSSSCVIKLIQDGWGFKSGVTKRCTLANCAKCHEDFDTCTECVADYEFTGLVCRSIGCGAECSLCQMISSVATCKQCNPSHQLFENQCIPTTVNLSLEQVDNTLRFTLGKTPHNDQLKQKLIISIDLLDEYKSRINSISSFTLELDLSLGILYIQTAEPQEAPDRFYLSISSQPWIFIPEQNIGVQGFNRSFRMTKKSYQKLIESAGSKGEQMSSFSDIQTNSAATGSVLLLAASLDPSGILIRLIQSMKMQSRLWYININYGDRLDRFLFNLEKSAKNDTATWTEYQKIMHSYRGKLSQRTISFSLYSLQFYQYLVSWIGLGAVYVITRLRKLTKWQLIAVYYFMKFRLIIFNSILIDFVWKIAHVLLHARDVSAWDYTILVVVLCGMLVDSSHIFFKTYENRVWLEYHRKKFSPNKDRLTFFQTNSKDSKPMIDHSRTYSTIFSNLHILFQTSSLMNDQKEVYGQIVFRVRYLYQIGKTVLYQLLILSCQYCTATALALMFSIEICYICLVIVCYTRRRHLKNSFFLVMELSQPVLLFFYLFMCLLIYVKSSIPEVYQDLGIWLVIISCIVEYVLLVVFVCVTAYIFCKNKRSQKSLSKGTVGSNWLFISYLDPQSPQGSLQRDIETMNKKEHSIQESPRVLRKNQPAIEAKVIEYIPQADTAGLTRELKAEEFSQQIHSQSILKIDTKESIFSRPISHNQFITVKTRGSLKITPTPLSALGRLNHRGSFFNKMHHRSTQETPEEDKQTPDEMSLGFETKQDEPQQTSNEASDHKLAEEPKDRDEPELSETPTMPKKNPLAPIVPSKFPLHKKIVKIVHHTGLDGEPTTNQDMNTRPPMRITEAGGLCDADEIQSIDIG